MKYCISIMVHLCLLLSGMLFLVRPALAQNDPVVYAVLFYSPTCPHCHTVIQNSLPPIKDEFGEALVVLYINVTTPDGLQMFREAGEQFGDDDWGGVPTLLIGSTVLVGDQQIPNELPALVQEGLKNGGIALPPILSIQEAYRAAVPEAEAVQPAVPETVTWQDRFNDDFAANTLAMMVLGILLASLAVSGMAGYTLLKTQQLPRLPDQAIITSLALFTVFLFSTLVLEFNGMPALIALFAGGLMMAFVYIPAKFAIPHQKLIPVLMLAGLMVAGYLTYVEVGENEAVCGVVGNCNLVQQSQYADFLGVLPIGVIGITGYILMLGIWSITLLHNLQLTRFAQAGLLLMALFGTAFSLYLTFLEPFVIGSTCIWCLTSAVLMGLILLIQLPEGFSIFMKEQPRA